MSSARSVRVFFLLLLRFRFIFFLNSKSPHYYCCGNIREKNDFDFRPTNPRNAVALSPCEALFGLWIEMGNANENRILRCTPRFGVINSKRMRHVGLIRNFL